MKTKMIMPALLISVALSSCTTDKAEEKNKMNEVIKTHDIVMGKSETAIKYRTALDSIIKHTTDTLKMHSAATLNSNLSMADNAMETWMHQFNPDFTGKPHTEVMDYLNAQQKQINRVDSLLTLSINKSDKFLKSK